jgi:hypothetical protein
MLVYIWLWVNHEPSHKLFNFRLKKYLQLCYGFATPVILSFMCQKPKTLKILILVRFQIYLHVEICILEHASVM